MLTECCDSYLWLVICGFLVAFILAFGIGANDVANSFGTSVGSKVLTMRQACILATIFEILGAILIGARVSGTIRNGIIDLEKFHRGDELDLMLGYVSALIGCCIWLILATILNLPVSGTHSIVGATVGMAVVSKGSLVVKWEQIFRIVLSWFISPLLSGTVSVIVFFLIRKFILRNANPLKAGLRLLPFIYTITIFINLGGILESSPPLLGLDRVPMYGKFIIQIGVSIIVYISVWAVLVPFMKRKVELQLKARLLDDNNDDNNNMGLEDLNRIASIEDKKTIGTQVDYVTLLIARNNSNNNTYESSNYNNISNYIQANNPNNDNNKYNDELDPTSCSDNSDENENDHLATHSSMGGIQTKSQHQYSHPLVAQTVRSNAESGLPLFKSNITFLTIP
jgi:phosphate/sulfate permease